MSLFKSLSLSAGLLLATPWFLTLILSRPSLAPLPRTLPWLEQISANLAYLTSDEFLFFAGDGRPGYGTGEHGVFLLSFLPLILIGVYQSRLILWWLLAGVAIAVVFGNVAGLPAALWYLPALSILATIGATRIIPLLKWFTPLYTFWLAFETALLYHTILIHQPFTP